jgi:predicted ATPase
MEILKTPNPNELLLMDEPDTALSISSIVKLYDILVEKSKTNQIIISVHNPLLISKTEVYSLDYYLWMSGKEYIQTRLNEK